MQPEVACARTGKGKWPNARKSCCARVKGFDVGMVNAIEPGRRWRAFWRGAIFAGLAWTLALSAADRPPERVSTTGGGGAKWTSLPELQAAAAKGDAAACLELGSMYEFGREVEENATRARVLYLQAAAGGLPEADFRLARLLSEGLGGPADLPGAYQRYMRAARAGMPLAQYNVGAMLASARGVRRNYVEGLAWIIIASRDPEVDKTGEEKLRARLAGRPRDIAAAELRAVTLEDELKRAREASQNNGATASDRPTVSVPLDTQPATMRPTVPVMPAPPPGLSPPPPVLHLPPAAPRSQ